MASIFGGSSPKGSIFGGGGGGQTSVPGSIFGSRKKSLARTEQELRELALAQGVDPEQATRSGPGPVERVADILSRGMYASTGFTEATLSGEENPFGRAFREFFSGTFGLHGDKRTYTEVFDEFGIPQGPKLFETSAVGLAGDIFLDPATYVTFGAGSAIRGYTTASKVGGKIAKVALSKKGRTMLKGLEETLRPRGREFAEALYKGIEDSKLVRQMTEKEVKARQALVKLTGDEYARQMARSEIIKRASIDASLKDAGGIKFFGRTVVPGEVIAAPLKRFGGSVTRHLEKGGALERGSLRMAREVSGWFDRVFNESVAQVRKLPGINLLKATMRDELHNGLREFDRATFGKEGVLNGIKKVKIANAEGRPVGRLFREGMSLDEYLPLHLDDPSRYPIELIPEEWRRAAHETRTMLDVWFQAEVAAKLLDERIWRENYFPHMFDNPREDLEKLSEFAAGQGKGTLGGPFRFGPWDEARTFRTYEDAFRAVDELKATGALAADFELKPKLKATEVLSLRAMGHHTGMAARRYMERIKQQFAKSNGEFNADWLEMLLPQVQNIFDGNVNALLDSGEIAARLAKVQHADGFQRLRELRPKWMTDQLERALRARPATLDRMVPEAIRLLTGKEATAAQAVRETGKARRYLAMSETMLDNARRAQRKAIARVVANTPAMSLGAPKGVRLTSYKRIATASDDELLDIAGRLAKDGSTEDEVRGFAAQLRQFRDSMPQDGLTKREARWLAQRLHKDFFVSPRTQRGIGRRSTATVLRQMRAPVQAAFLQARLSRVNDMKELLRIVDDFRPVIDELDMGLYNIVKHATNETKSALKVLDGDRFVFVGRKGLKTVLQNAKPGVTKSVRGMVGGWWLPEGLIKDVGAMQERVLNMTQVRGMLNAFDVISDVFKGMVTVPFPAFHFRNHYSNVAQNFVSIGLNALNPVRYVQAARIMAGADGTLRTPIGRYTFDEVRALANEAGVFKDFAQIAELRSSPTSWIRQYVVQNPVFTPGAAAGAGIENSARLINFVKHLEDGFSPEEAAAKVKEFLFDYEALSVAEKDILSRIFPFYKWTRKNVELTARQIAKNPGRYAAFFKTVAAGNRGPEHETMPHYLRGDLKVRMREGPGKALYLMGIDLPVNSAIETIFTGDMIETLRQKAAMVAPALKILIEVPTKTDLFTGRSLEERQQLGLIGQWAKAGPDWLQDFLELKESVGPTGESEFSMNGLKAYLLLRSWAQARLLTTADRLTKDPNQDFVQMVADIGFGFRTREFELTREQDKKIRRNIRMLRKRLVQRGTLRELPVYFEPAAP